MQSDGTYPAGRLNVAKAPYALLYGDDIQGMGRKSWGKTAGILWRHLRIPVKGRASASRFRLP